MACDALVDASVIVDVADPSLDLPESTVFSDYSG